MQDELGGARADDHVKNTYVITIWDKNDFEHSDSKGKQNKGIFF